MGIGNSNTSVDPVITGSGSNNQILLGDSALKFKNGTAVQNVIDTAGKTVNKIIESGGDIITAPAVWLRDIQQNWLSYMVIAAIILSILLFFYCSFCFYFRQKKINSSSSHLIDLAKIINYNNGILQKQSPLSVLNLPSLPSNIPTESRA